MANPKIKTDISDDIYCFTFMVFFNETNFVCTIIIKIFIQIYNETVNYELKCIKEEIILIMIKTIFFLDYSI